MDFTVAIVTCNRAESLRHSLDALANQDFPLERTEIIVADNGSVDHTKAVFESFTDRFPDLKYVFDARPGQLVGWHLALAIAKGAVTCFIDDDVRPSPGWLSALADAYRDPRVGLATGPIRLAFEDEPSDWLENMTLGEPNSQTVPLLGGLDLGERIRDIPGNFVWGSNFSVRQSVLRDVGGFHPCAMPWPLIRFYGDGEIHVGRTAQQRGNRILYHPQASVDHEIPAARLTLDSVERKFTSTGCARAFQTLRTSDRVFDAPSSNDIRAMARRYFRNPDVAPHDLAHAVEAGLDRGMTIQRDAFLADPQFRDWVMRENYLDLDLCYTHPDLAVGVKVSSGDWRSGA